MKTELKTIQLNVSSVDGETIAMSVNWGVAAAGNGRSEIPFYPAALDDVLAVSATRDDDTRWSLSNYGSWIDVAAPGYAIYSTYYDLNNSYGGYQFMSGTSMAAPHVASVAGVDNESKLVTLSGPGRPGAAIQCDEPG